MTAAARVSDAPRKTHDSGMAPPPDGERKIFEFFDELSRDESHFRSSNDICTPMGCVKEMADAVPAELWKRKDLKVLDCCCGNGNFHAYIQTKAPLRALYFNDINRARIRNARKFFGAQIRVFERDFLRFPEDDKYDLVVSNPPYAKFCGDRRAPKNHNLSRACIAKALRIAKDGGYVLFIAPDNWMSFSDRNILPRLTSGYQFAHLNIHGAKKWFPSVGSSFTWFLLRKTPNAEKFTVENHYKKRDVVRAAPPRDADFIPLYYSDVVRGLMQKTAYSAAPKYPVETTGDLHRFTKKRLLAAAKDCAHPHRLIHTPRQTVWSARPHKFQDGWKVFISLSDRYKTFVDNCGMTQSVAFVRCGSKAEAERVKKELDSPVYRCINNLTRYGDFNNIRVLQRLPLAEHVRLTAREKELVRHFAAAI